MLIINWNYGFIILYFNKYTDKKVNNKIYEYETKINILFEEKESNWEIGEEEKCLECDSKSNVCSSFNLGYKLVNGKCIVYYSFKATYYCKADNKNIKLINSSYVKDIIEISMNNKTIPVSENYRFPSAGNYTLYFLMKNPSSNSWSKIFIKIENMI